MNQKEIIEAVINLISDPKKWTVGTFARDVEGLICYPSDSRAVCWCVVGAIQKFSTTEHEMTTTITGLNDYVYDHHCNNLTDINDIEGREKVIKVLQEYLTILE